MARDRRRFGSGGVVALTLHDTHLAAISRASPLALEYHAEHKARQARFRGLAHDFAKRQCALAAPRAGKPVEAIVPAPVEKPKSAQFTAVQAELKASMSLRTLDVQRVVADHYGLTVEDLIGQRRFVKITWPRQIAIWLVNQELPLKSTLEIARAFNRDPTTAIHAIRKITRRLESDVELAEAIDAMRATIVRPVNERKPLPPVREILHYARAPDGSYRPPWHLEAMAMFSNGASVEEICVALGKTKYRIRGVLNIDGVRYRGRNYDLARRQRAKLTRCAS